METLETYSSNLTLFLNNIVNVFTINILFYFFKKNKVFIVNTFLKIMSNLTDTITKVSIFKITFAAVNILRACSYTEARKPGRRENPIGEKTR